MNNSLEEKHELFEKIWNETKKDLLVFCKFKMQSCYSEIDDVIADAFFCLWKAICNDLKINNYKGWLFTVTDHLIMKKYSEANTTKKQQICVTDIEDEIACFVNEEVFIDSLVTDSVIERVKNEVIHKLNRDEQELYTCVYEDKMKTKDIAALKNTTESAIKQKRYRLNKKLKLTMKKQLEEMWMYGNEKDSDTK